MSTDEQIQACPEVSEEFRTYDEFCTENTGRELTYFELVAGNPVEMDPITLAFSMRHLVRLTRELIDFLLESVRSDPPPDLRTLLGFKGIQLDKSHAESLRRIIFSFRDCEDEGRSLKLARAFQLMTITRERSKVVFNVGESYSNPDESWNVEDFGGDESILEAVRSIEDSDRTKP